MPERSPEVQAEIGTAVASVQDMDEQQLREMLTVRNVELHEKTSPGWMAKKLRYMLQQEILEKHGLKETKTMSERQEEVDAQTQTEGEEKKPGRKRMNKSGSFKVHFEGEPNLGRDGSTKNGILKALIDKDAFTYAEFEAAVAGVMQWDATKEEFGCNTKFPNLGAASNAWFSELKNKAKIIIQVTDAAA